MSTKIAHKLQGVPRTLLITLLVRARESRKPNGAIRDEKALEIVERIDANFGKLVLRRHDEVAIIVRMLRFDQCVRNFLQRNPQGVVVHIGCGLDTRYERIGAEEVEWFDLDLPEVMDLRAQLIDSVARHYHRIAGSVFEDGWMAQLEPLRPRPILFISEGVLPYFEEELVKGFFTRLLARFPGCEVVCDGHTPFAIWADNLHLALAGEPLRMHWGLKDPHDVEGWGQGIRLLEQWYYFTPDEPLMRPFRWIGLFPALARSVGIFHYQMGRRP